MRCPTCGEILEPGSSRCPTCGAALAVPAPSVALESLHRCPRCSYTGRGMPYFRRPGHVALLVGVSLFTQGIGGLVYWLLRRNHRICPRCGLDWEQSYALAGAGHAPASLAAAEGSRGQTLPSGGVKRRILGTLLIAVAAIVFVVGLAEFEPAAIIVGSMMGATGSGVFFWGWRAQQERRQGIMAGLQQQVLRLATRRGGTLTVTEVAADLNLSIQAAEKVLIEMDDGFRVRSDVTPEGILLFEFPEVQHRPRLESGGDQA